MDAMLKKLRVKFVAIIMAIVFAVLAVAFVTICAITYNQDVGTVQEALENAVMRDAAPGDRGGGGQWRLQDGVGPGKHFEIGGKGMHSFIPVAVYEVEADGTLSAVSMATSGFMTEDVLAQASSLVAARSEGFGSLGTLQLMYLKCEMGDVVYVAFADESSASGWKPLALMLTGVGVCALAVFFVLALFFSRWALRPVSESWKKQQQFVADASHELKTPLTVMAADVAILSHNADKTVASQSQWVESMESEISNMQDLVGDMLMLASADEGLGAEMDSVEKVDLSKLVMSQLLQFESLAYERGVKLESKVDDGIFIEACPERLRRMVGTLLDNAYKYAGKGGRVDVRLLASGESKVLTVTNTGAAIPAEDLPHVFDRFYRVDKARGRDAGRSFGLGLAIAKETAEQMGATMSVASDEKSGTTFTVTFK